MKTLFMVNGNFKKEGDIIGKKELELAQLLVPCRVAKHFFHSTMLRTAQVLLAAVTAARGMNGKVYPPIHEFGNDVLFNPWEKWGLASATAKHGSILNGLRSIIDKKEFQSAQQTALEGIRKAIRMIPENEYGLAVGHSPIIELAMEAAGFNTIGLELGFLEGAIFIEKDGVISILDPINISQPA